MRRSAWWLLGVSAVVMVSTTPAAAAPAPSPSVSQPPAVQANQPAPEQVCTIDDNRIREVSGLVALPGGGYAVINDGNRDQSAQRIFRLDSGCRYRGSSVAYQPNALDPEDLAVAPDGTLWSADIGDNSSLTGGAGPRRPTVALWKVSPGATKPTIYRFTYPDGAHDAEALLLKSDGTPLIVTKEFLEKPAGIYAPTAAPVANSTTGVKLQRVGEFAPQQTRTPNPLGPIGSLVVTGAATSPDGRRVALRTYSDAYEWDVPDGDIVKAITTGKPRITPLPNEQGGESLAYTADGKSFLTASDLEGPTPLLRYTPAAPVAAPAPASSTAAQPLTDNRSFFQRITLQQIMQLVIAVGVLGVLLVVIGVVGIRRSRRARRAEALGSVRGVASVARGSGGAGPGDGGSGGVAHVGAGPGGDGTNTPDGRTPPDRAGRPGSVTAKAKAKVVTAATPQGSHPGSHPVPTDAGIGAAGHPSGSRGSGTVYGRVMGVPEPAPPTSPSHDTPPSRDGRRADEDHGDGGPWSAFRRH